MSAQKTKAAGHLAAIFTMLIWGTTFISTKVLLEDLSPLEILVLRFVAGYIFLWIIRPVPLKAGSLKQEGIMIVAGITGIGIYYLMENIALTLTQASNISARIAVEGEITVSVCKGMYQCQGRMHFVVHQQIFRADTKLLQRFFQCFSKLIISYFSNKGSFLPKVI